MNSAETTPRPLVEEQAFEISESIVEGGSYILQTIWNESLDAELDGDLTLALEIHGQILTVVGRSCTAYLRAGWLHYQAGGFKQALKFYGKAAECSPDSTAPLLGAMGCYASMADSVESTRLAKKIARLDEEKRSSKADAAFQSLPPSSCAAIAQSG
ncbi:tetratricopeptide repeat protein [Pontiella sulfatireligans]|uniref:Uncharacterized protein n=1 Tax=Pontiella sulfatireligans TaxID=2750658 RepID=A0A6C2UQA5_9BACT|nr:hypothetical protein [Pontiella sulfatireligans]VGO21186.1 hypothetical protein SCARR_03257 [Pontiella sulfatireligans]